MPPSPTPQSEPRQRITLLSAMAIAAALGLAVGLVIGIGQMF